MVHIADLECDVGDATFGRQSDRRCNHVGGRVDANNHAVVNDARQADGDTPGPAADIEHAVGFTEMWQQVCSTRRGRASPMLGNDGGLVTMGIHIVVCHGETVASHRR